MRTWNRFFLFCLAGTVLLGVGIVFVPRYFSRNLDMQEANQITMVSRDDFSFLEQSEGTVMEHVKVLRNLRPDSDGLTLVTSVTDADRVNDDIIKNVYDQVMDAAACGMLPWLSPPIYYDGSAYENWEDIYQYWGDRIKFARYYSLAYDSETNPNTKELMNFWILRFSDNKAFDYYFLVDAVTFRVYYAELYNSFTDQAARYWEYWVKPSEDDKTEDYNAEKLYQEQFSDFSAEYFWMFYDLFGDGCLNYYGADDYKNIIPGNQERISLVVLNFDQEAAYIEGKIVADPLSENYQGISIGLQGLDTSVRALLK